jgi:hypothetical protein
VCRKLPVTQCPSARLAPSYDSPRIALKAVGPWESPAPLLFYPGHYGLPENRRSTERPTAHKGFGTLDMATAQVGNELQRDPPDTTGRHLGLSWRLFLRLLGSQESLGCCFLRQSCYIVQVGLKIMTFLS